MMSRRALLLAALAFIGTIGGYLLSQGHLGWPRLGG